MDPASRIELEYRRQEHRILSIILCGGYNVDHFFIFCPCLIRLCYNRIKKEHNIEKRRKDFYLTWAFSVLWDLLYARFYSSLSDLGATYSGFSHLIPSPMLLHSRVFTQSLFSILYSFVRMSACPHRLLTWQAMPPKRLSVRQEESSQSSSRCPNQ